MTNPFATFDFKKYMDNFQLSAFDPAGLFEIQKKNVDAFVNASKMASECAQAIARKQTEMVQQSFEQATAAFQQTMSTNGKAAPDMNFSKQAEYAQAVMEKTVKNARDISEMVSATNREVFSLMNKRFSESVAETQAAMNKATAKKASA